MKRLLLTLTFLLFAMPAFAQPRFPQRGVEVIDALLRNGQNQLLAKGNDADRRTLTRKIIEQIICEFPNGGYTWKSASPSRPPSKDAIGIVQDGQLYGWDWQNGSTRQRQVNAGKVAEEWPGQNPISLGCVNHLNASVPSQPVPVPPAPAPDVPSQDVLLDLLASLESQIAVAAHEAKQAAERAARIEGKVDALTVSHEEHREESRKVRNKVFGVLKEIAPYAGALAAWFFGQKK